jgi:hypothetical protein
MSDHVVRLKQAYADWKASGGANVDQWLSIMAPDGKIGSLAGGAPGAEFTRGGEGHGAVREYLEQLFAGWEMLEYDMDDYVVDGDRVVVLGEVAFRNRDDARMVRTPKADIWRFRGDMAVEFYEFYDTAQVRGIG